MRWLLLAGLLGCDTSDLADHSCDDHKCDLGKVAIPSDRSREAVPLVSADAGAKD